MPIVRWSPERVIAPCKAGFKPAAAGLEKVAQGLAPRKSGRLAAATTVTITGETSGILHVPGVSYAGAVIGGAKPHEIDLRDQKPAPFAPVLAWPTPRRLTEIRNSLSWP